MTQWFLDFDETLVVGPVTWAIETVLPTMIRENQLPLDQLKLDAALLRGQEQVASGMSDMEVLEVLFNDMGWPHHLRQNLLNETFERYVPTPYEDTLSFLQQVGSVYVLSNNDRSPQIAANLGLTPYIKGFFTPKLCGVSRGKPQRDLWDFVTASYDVENAILVGDDPWSDGAFADACGIGCILVDRMNRFGHLTQYRRVTSLTGITAIPDASASAAPE